jgi:hypothetical protein
VIRRTNSRPSPSSNVVSGKNGFYPWNLVHRASGLGKEEAELDERATEARGTGGSDCGSGVHFRVPVQTDLEEDWGCNIEDLCDQGSRLQAYRAVGERRLSVQCCCFREATVDTSHRLQMGTRFDSAIGLTTGQSARARPELRQREADNGKVLALQEQGQRTMEKARSGATGEYSGAKAKARLGRLGRRGRRLFTSRFESRPYCPRLQLPSVGNCESVRRETPIPYPRTLSLASLARRKLETLLRGITSLHAAYRAVCSRFRSRDLALGPTTRFNSFAFAFWQASVHIPSPFPTSPHRLGFCGGPRHGSG